MSEWLPLRLDWHRCSLNLCHSLQWGASEVPEPFTTTPHRCLPHKPPSAMYMQFPQLQLPLPLPPLPLTLPLLTCLPVIGAASSKYTLLCLQFQPTTKPVQFPQLQLLPPQSLLPSLLVLSFPLSLHEAAASRCTCVCVHVQSHRLVASQWYKPL